MHPSDIDQHLVRQAQSGDQQAFNVLVTRYQPRLQQALWRYIRNHVEIADLLQDTFSKAYCALPSFQGNSSFYSWIYRIAINNAKNYLISQNRWQDVEIPQAEDWLENARDRGTPTPEHALLDSEFKADFNEALTQLSDDLRTVMVLRVVMGMSYDEIACTEDCPIGTVRSRLHRAQASMVRALGDAKKK